MPSMRLQTINISVSCFFPFNDSYSIFSHLRPRAPPLRDGEKPPPPRLGELNDGLNELLEEDGVKLLPLRVDGKEDGLYVERLLRAGCLVVVAERVGRNVVLPEELRLQVVPLLLRAVRVRE